MSVAENEAWQAERDYLGEPAPRRPWVAGLMGLVSPGLGWAYVGRPASAMSISLPLLGLWWLAYVLFTRVGFSPLLPLAVLLGGTVLWTAWTAWEAARYAHRVSDRYVLSDANHPLTYGVVASMAWWVPMLVLWFWVVPTQWVLTHVDSSAMAPTLLEGDVVLVRRISDQRTLAQLRHGDVVAIRGSGGPPRFARLVGMPHESVAMAEDTVFVNDAANVRTPVNPEDATAWIATSAPLASDAETLFLEVADNRLYASISPRMATWGEPVSWALQADQWFVLHDHRGHLHDSRTRGPVATGDLLGRAHWVVYAGSSAERELRSGRRIGPPRVPPRERRADEESRQHEAQRFAVPEASPSR